MFLEEGEANTNHLLLKKGHNSLDRQAGKLNKGDKSKSAGAKKSSTNQLQVPKKRG